MHVIDHVTMKPGLKDQRKSVKNSKYVNSVFKNALFKSNINVRVGWGGLGGGQGDVCRFHTGTDDALPGPHYHECFIISLLVHNGNNSTEGSGLATAHQPSDGPA